MRAYRKIILGAAALTAAGAAGLAMAEIANAHVLTLRLPDGSIEHIRYAGDQPPRVSLEAGPAVLGGVSPIADVFAADSPFVELERVSAAMDRQMEGLLRQANAVSGPAIGGPDNLMQVDLSKLPAGTEGYSVVSTLSGTGVCTRSVQYKSAGDGKPPRILTRTSGDCRAEGGRDAGQVAASERDPSPPLLQTAYRRGAE